MDHLDQVNMEEANDCSSTSGNYELEELLKGISLSANKQATAESSKSFENNPEASALTVQRAHSVRRNLIPVTYDAFHLDGIAQT